MSPRREFSGPTSFEITILVVQLWKLVFPDLLNKMRTFSLMWGPHREFTGPTSFESIDFPDLFRYNADLFSNMET